MTAITCALYTAGSGVFHYYICRAWSLESRRLPVPEASCDASGIDSLLKATPAIRAVCLCLEPVESRCRSS